MLLKAKLHRKLLKKGNLGYYSDLGVSFCPMALYEVSVLARQGKKFGH